MNKNWILQTSEIRNPIAKKAWIPLREICELEYGHPREIGYTDDLFACTSIAFPVERTEFVEKRIDWQSAGLIHDARPFVTYKTKKYNPVDKFYWDEEADAIGVHLIFKSPARDKNLWIINPDLTIALGLVKEGDDWLCVDDNYNCAIRETFDALGNHSSIEIKKTYLLDYLAARGLYLRIFSYRSRTINIDNLSECEQDNIREVKETREGGDFELDVVSLNKIYGGDIFVTRISRSDLDANTEVPDLNSSEPIEDIESYVATPPKLKGYSVRSTYYRDEWIKHQGKSYLIRDDEREDLPSYFVDNDGRKKTAAELRGECIGCWLWFKPSVVNDFLNCRCTSLVWYTENTGCICFEDRRIDFGVNKSDLITVYASDVAESKNWQQVIWSANNVIPEGGLSTELERMQISLQEVKTEAPEVLLYERMVRLEEIFNAKFGEKLFRSDISDDYYRSVLRFRSLDESSLFNLAKEIVKVFTERMNQKVLKRLSKAKNKEELRQIKLLLSIVAESVGEDRANEIFSVIFATNDLRNNAAHSGDFSDLEKYYLNAGIDKELTCMKKGLALIQNYATAIEKISEIISNRTE